MFSSLSAYKTRIQIAPLVSTQIILRLALKSLYLVLLLSFLTGCNNMPDWLKNWQKKQIEKRYGKTSTSSGQLQEWEESVREYEEQMNEKIKASTNAGKIYRKLGESYGQLEQFQLCVKNLEKAIELGYTIPEVFYGKAICEGNLARRHAWDREMTLNAEKGFLKVLNLNPDFEKAKYSLSLIYFHGFGKSTPYSIAEDIITISQSRFREKAVNLMKEYQLREPEESTSTFALSGFYSKMGLKDLARAQLNQLMAMIRKSIPSTYATDETYKKALQNLTLLGAAKP